MTGTYTIRPRACIDTDGGTSANDSISRNSYEKTASLASVSIIFIILAGMKSDNHKHFCSLTITSRAAAQTTSYTDRDVH